jgi:hypothetical protein
MKQKDFEALRKGNYIQHKHYGLCIVDDYTPHFGPIIRPLTIYGFNKLELDSSTLFNRLLEHSPRMIQEKVDNPVIPDLMFKVGEEFQIHEWVEQGEVSREGVFSTNLIESFPTLDQAITFADNRLKTKTANA